MDIFLAGPAAQLLARNPPHLLAGNRSLCCSFPQRRGGRAALLAVLLCLCGLMLAPASQALHQPLWELGIGVGALSTPPYRGSDSRVNYIVPFPYFIYRGSFLRVDREGGIRGKLFSGDDISFDLSLAANVPVRNEDDGARRGMDDLDPLIELGTELSIDLWRSQDRDQRFGLDIPLRAVYSVGNPLLEYQGLTLSPFLNYRIWQEDEGALMRYSLSAGPIFATSRYHDYFYEVDSRFVTPERPEYHADSGYSGSRVTISVTRHFSKYLIGAFARYDDLNGAVFEDSPLVETSDYFVVGLVFGWILGESSTMVQH
jgi:outer membrane scaffolding protein for murein synthesis (MipA/OmpV family)